MEEITEIYTESAELRKQIHTTVNEVFQIPKAGAGLWKSLKRFKNEKATTYTMSAEVEALMGSFYGPRIPVEEIKIPEKEYIGKSTMQAFADSKRSDFSISGGST
jgi:hypothetical protein